MDVRQLFAQSNRYVAAARKILSLKGEGPGVSFGVHLEDERPEHSFIKGERAFVQYNEVTSAAGTLSIVRVTNPANSGVLAIITRVHATLTAPAVVDVGWIQNVLNTLGGGPMWLLDTRWASPTVGTTTVCGAGTAAAGGVTGVWDKVDVLAAGAVMDLVAPGGRIPFVVLRPGDGFQVYADVVGVNTLKTMIAGYERSLESGELIPT